MTTAYVAMGGNTGDVAGVFRQTIRCLDSLPKTSVSQVSESYRTAPVGEHSGGPFLNAAVELETGLGPENLLQKMQGIEQDAGRTRGIPWGPRPLDLDLIFFGDQIIQTHQLQVPHPACWYRRFVLDPLSEIASEFPHPLKRRTVAQLQKRLIRRPFRCVLMAGPPESREDLVESLQLQFSEAVFTVASPSASWGEQQATLLIWLGQSCGDSTDWSAIPSAGHVGWIDASSHTQQEMLPFLRNVLASSLGDSTIV